MTPSNVQALSDILVLSLEMKQSAELSEWGRVQAQEEQRQLLIQTCLPLSDAVPDVETVAEQLRQIIDLDRQVMALVAQGRDEASAAIDKMSQGRTAVQAYQKTGS